MVMNRNGENSFGAFLTDNIIVENFLDFHWCRNTIARPYDLALVFFADDVHAKLDAFITYEHVRTCDQFPDLMLALSAKGAIKCVFGFSGTGLGHLLFPLLQP